MSDKRPEMWDAATLNSMDCWDYSIELECLQGPEDLQLAAELGKTLLSHNKDLEDKVAVSKSKIEDQRQEIEYITKQYAALREVNDSRLRIYEQLEVSIQELERENQRFRLEISADKKYIKSLCATVETWETRNENLQRSVDEMKLQQDSFRRRNQRNSSLSPGDNFEENRDESVEEIVVILSKLQDKESQLSKAKRKIDDLEDQLKNAGEDNSILEEQLENLKQKEADMRSMQEEMATLEEVRQGHLCGRCLRNVDTHEQDELSLLMDHEEEDDISVVNSLVSETHRSTLILQIEDDNHVPNYESPYRVLVQKYEALVQMQRPMDCKRHSATANSLSLQEELQMSGDFNSFNAKDIESEHETDVVIPAKANSKTIQQNRGPAEKTFSMTPTDFSEAETSSSGFSDETSNKTTQTDNNPPPGSFLCSIADGTDCRFSIYDDANPVESRFRKKPQYRQLFREIFDVLKRAAENKDEGEQPPLLDDFIPLLEAPKVPPATPAREDYPDNFPPKGMEPLITEEDSKSIADELAAIADSLPDCSKLPENAIEKDISKSAEPIVAQVAALEPLKKTPPKQDILEYLSIGVGIRKKSNKKNSPAKAHRLSVAERIERIESPTVGGSPKSGGNCNGRRRRESRFAERLADSAPTSRSGSPGVNAWYNRDAAQASSSRGNATSHTAGWDFKPFISSASQEVAKLKRLEKSYAEVLRLGPQTSHRPKTMSINVNGFRRQ